MSALAISVTVVLAVVFLIITLECLLRHSVSYIFTQAADEEDSIEARLRILLRENPNSEIYVFDSSKTAETQIILEKLSEDFPGIHIVKRGELQ